MATKRGPLAGSDGALPRLLTVAQAAEYLHITKEAVRNRIARGELPATRNGGILYILADDLVKQLRANMVVTR